MYKVRYVITDMEMQFSRKPEHLKTHVQVDMFREVIEKMQVDGKCPTDYMFLITEVRDNTFGEPATVVQLPALNLNEVEKLLRDFDEA